MSKQTLELYIEQFKNTSDKNHKEVVMQITDDLEKQVLQKLAVFIADTRAKKGLTVRDLNERSNVALAVINDLEKARSMPRVESLIRLGIALEINFNDIFNALKLPDIVSKSKCDSKTALAMDLSKYNYDKNQVAEIMEFIKFIDFKTKLKNNKSKERI